MSRKKQIVGSAARDSVMISRNGQFGAAIALILRLQAIATAAIEAHAGQHLDPETRRTERSDTAITEQMF
jgi:hypothetical protein